MKGPSSLSNLFTLNSFLREKNSLAVVLEMHKKGVSSPDTNPSHCNLIT